MTLATKLGIAVRRARQAKHLTTKDLALAAGVSRSTLEKLEAGDPGVSIANAQKAMDALHLTLSHCLATETEPMPLRRRVRAKRGFSQLNTNVAAAVTFASPKSQATAPDFSPANREREYDAVRGVKTLLVGKKPLHRQMTGTTATYADVAALLATLAPKGSPVKAALQQVARENHGVVARAVNLFSPQRLIAMARSQGLFTRQNTEFKA